VSGFQTRSGGLISGRISGANRYPELRWCGKVCLLGVPDEVCGRTMDKLDIGRSGFIRCAILPSNLQSINPFEATWMTRYSPAPCPTQLKRSANKIPVNVSSSPLNGDRCAEGLDGHSFCSRRRRFVCPCSVWTTVSLWVFPMLNVWRKVLSPRAVWSKSKRVHVWTYISRSVVIVCVNNLEISCGFIFWSGARGRFDIYIYMYTLLWIGIVSGR